MTWNPDAYLRFGDERTRPSLDLASRIDVEPATVIDLGCGPGNSTQVLAARWPAARVVGLDNSAEMIASARDAYPDREWELGSIGEWSAEEPFDVVFSNAALQWVPDHAELVPRLFEQVAPGGALAFQIPSRTYARVGTLIHEIARDGAWAPRMEAALRQLTMESPETYYDLLAPKARAMDVWETEYLHVLDSPPAIVAWISSTGLRPFLGALGSDADREAFVAELTRRVEDAYPRRADGRVLFGFRRTFVIAYA